ncbi:MAG: DegT/DnrJ/EryC1/StrS family aminotransferase, partial [Muribaculaceae bacterium]|nr:DegT/DnrJ/EryC1/StrS family aminotransferase [Muribaculaceae bacterium]
RHDLLVVEDNAQAIGACSSVAGFSGAYTTGALGHAAAFSFYPTKNIGALGDAGAVTTDDEELAATVRALANYGSRARYINIYEGYNCRLDPLQAAFLNVKLDHLPEENSRRRRLASVYDAAITHPDVRRPSVTDGSVWHQYVVRVQDRDAFRSYLEASGVGTDVNYPTPPHLQPCYSRFSHLDLPVAQELARTVVCLPVSSATSPDDARAIANIINDYRPC